MLTDLQYRILRVINISPAHYHVTAVDIQKTLGLDAHGIGGATRALRKRGYIEIRYDPDRYTGVPRYYIKSAGSVALTAYEAAQKAQTEANQAVLKWRNMVLSELESDRDGNRFVFAVLRGDYDYTPAGGLMGVIDATYGWRDAFQAAVAVMATYMNIVRQEGK